MPRKQRPPIHLLEVFEAAARLESFKLAGEELHISASAVSHQIKNLEQILEIQLFKRITRGVKVTRAGREYAFALNSAFRKIDEASKQFLKQQQQTRVKISIMPSLANNLIHPNLSQFKQQHPDIALEIDSCEELSDLNDDEIDFAIRYGFGDWPSYQSQLLRRCHGVIVASPEFLEAHPITQPEDLQQLPLICLNQVENAWYALAKSLKIKNFSIQHPLNYHSYGAGIQAAQQDLGLATAIYELEKNLIDKQKLVPVLGYKSELNSGIYLVRTASKPLSAASKQVLQWLKMQIASL